MARTTWLITFALMVCIAGQARAQWGGLDDKSAELMTGSYSFTGNNPDAGQTNENYYDGDMGDFDGDGLPDRILGARYGLLFNTGSGLMTPARIKVGFLLRGDPGASNWGEDAFQFADVDGDGDLDGLAGGNGEPLTAQLNNSGRFTVGWVITGGKHSALNIVNTDVERDGDVDLVVAHAFCSNSSCGGPVELSLFINDGSGGMTEQSTARGLDFGATDYIVGVASGDLDGDRDFDLVIEHGGGNQVLVARNNGTGQYTLVPNALPTTCSGFGQGITLGDVDLDGDLDVAIGRCGAPYSGGDPVVSHVIGINDGSGNFSDQSATRLDHGGFSQLPEISGGDSELVDIDYDGDLDLIAFNKDNMAAYTHFQVFLNDGTGNFTYAAMHSVFTSENAQALGNDVDIADLDGDGSYDVWVGVSGGNVKILLNTHAPTDGLPADVPRLVQVESESSSGIALAWDVPTFAATARYYKVYRATAPGLEARDKQLVKVVGMSPFQDEAFSAPITQHTTTAYLADPDVTLGGNRVHYLDATASPGITYYYSVVHVGPENAASRQSVEASGMVPAAGNDTSGPELMISGPKTQDWSRFARIVAFYGDPSGVDPATLSVSLDQPLGGGMRPAGDNLVDLAYRHDDGAFILPLVPPLDLPMDTLVTVTASVADTLGNPTTATAQYFVSVDAPSYPTAMMAALTPPMNPLVFSADGSSDSDGKVMRWEWYFGDGTSGLGRNVTKQYQYGGSYDVLLLVRDDHGGVATATQSITVDGPAPPPGTGGAGGAGGGAATGTGVGGAGAVPEGDGDSGCGCALVARSSTAAWGAMLALALVLARRRVAAR